MKGRQGQQDGGVGCDGCAERQRPSRAAAPAPPCLEPPAPRLRGHAGEGQQHAYRGVAHGGGDEGVGHYEELEEDVGGRQRGEADEHQRQHVFDHKLGVALGLRHRGVVRVAG